MADFEDGLEGFLTNVDDDGQRSESLRGGCKFVIVCRQLALKPAVGHEL